MIRPIARSLAIGVALGMFSALGDYLPVQSPFVVLVALANAVSPWVVAAFFAGAAARGPRRGGVLGAAALLAAVVTYYVAANATMGSVFADPMRATAVWAGVAMVVGGPMGALGAVWAAGDHPRRDVAVGLLGSVLLAEAIARFIEVEGWTGYDLARTALQVAAVDAIVAVLAPLLLLDRGRRTAAAVSLGVGLAGAALLVVIVPLIRGAASG